MRAGVFVCAVLLASCGGAATRNAANADTAGDALERAAIARGIVADPASIDPVGVYSSDTDRVCIVARDDGYAIGASVDYGEAQSCTARGTATGRATLDVRFQQDCRFTAKIEGDRITFPALLPAACDTVCIGRASLAALTAERLSRSGTEAASTIGPGGTRLCN